MIERLFFQLTTGVLMLNKCYYFDIVFSLQVLEVQYRQNGKVYRFTIFNRQDLKVYHSWTRTMRVHREYAPETGLRARGLRHFWYLLWNWNVLWKGGGEREVPTTLFWSCSSERITRSGINRGTYFFVCFILVLLCRCSKLSYLLEVDSLSYYSLVMPTRTEYN